MELLAMTMRAEGMLSCRSLSFRGTAFRLVPVALKAAISDVYAASCAFWQASFRLATRLFKAKKAFCRANRTKGSGELQDNTFRMRQFWNCQQQFFKQLILCAKVDEVASLASAARLREESVVISMWSTGESVTQAR